MAVGAEVKPTRRGLSRIRQLFGISNTLDTASQNQHEPGRSIHYGMFSTSELRHVDGVIANPTATRLQPMDIVEQLKSVSSNSKKMIDELDTLQMMAPEIGMAETIIVSSILSPTDLQTDLVSVTVDSKDVSESVRTKVTELLTNYFNNEFKLGPKLVDWLGTAAFHEGAKAIMIMPQAEIDILNTVADRWDPKYQGDFRYLKEKIESSTEGLCIKNSELEDAAIESLASVACESFMEQNVGESFLTEEQKEKFKKEQSYTDKDGKTIEVTAPTTASIAKDLMSNSFKMLKPSPDGCGVIVTRDLSPLNKCVRNASQIVNQFTAEAEKQISGYKADDQNNMLKPQFPVLSISDIIKTNEGDMPILIEFPTDSVIPVCAPGDNKNHLGYFILVNEFGQPIRGEYAFDGTTNGDITHRLATNAARAVFGQQNISSFQMAGMTDAQVMDNLTRTFSIAVNYLLKSKLGKDGLKGLNVNVHEAVGKALFYNLLAKNQIKMIFVPEPMMVYYRFDHRPDGTGKSMLENIKFLLAMRCTLMIAKMMAAIENATKHRVIEVQVDDKNVNPVETMEIARQTFINKRAPNISNDPRTAVESIINQHLTIKPKGIAGVVEDLNVDHSTTYGNAQGPGDDLLDTLNNMIGQGVKIPATVLNNLNEAEYARSIATSNLFFANNVRHWQAIIKPFNKKFLTNYILSCNPLLKDIQKIVEEDLTGSADPASRDNTSDCIKQSQTDKSAPMLVRKLLASVELNLAPPNMSTTKAHYEELGAQADAIEKTLNLLYPDDVAPSDELRSFMSALRAMVGSKLIKDFLPKLGVHDIAEVPSIEEIETDDLKKILLFLGNLRARSQHLEKLITGQLPKDPKIAAENKPEGGGLGSGSSGSDGGGDGGMGDFKLPDF